MFVLVAISQHCIGLVTCLLEHGEATWAHLLMFVLLDPHIFVGLSRVVVLLTLGLDDGAVVSL
jgi:hypothetical protein